MKPATITRRTLVLLTVITLIIPSHGLGADESSTKEVRAETIAAKPAMREVTMVGYTRARHVMDLVSEESGRCVKVVADVGDTIGKGGAFCVLDRTFVDLALKKNRVDQKRLESEIAYQLKEVSRFEKLVGRESAAQSTLDGLQKKLDQARFQLEALKTEEATLKERWVRHAIKAPSGWTVTERNVEPGQWVSAGTHVGKAADYNRLLIPFSLSPEEYAALKKQNGTAQLRFPDEGQGGVVIEGKVERVSPAFDPQTRKMSVDLAVSEGVSEMRGGLRVELDIEIPDPSGTVLVPGSALAERYEEFWLTRENGDQVRVVFLGNGSQGAARVRSPEVKPGQLFRTKAGE
jgi:RND family efflux transporter MFP subunit